MQRPIQTTSTLRPSAAGHGEERAGRSAAFAFLAQMVGAALTAILTLFLARWLSAAQYGSFTFALGVAALATLVADLGVTASTGRYMAERRSDLRAAGSVFRTALRLKLRIGLGASIVLFALAAPICSVFGTPAATWPLRGFAVSLFAESIFMLLMGAFIALGRLRYNLVVASVESATEVCASIALVLLGGAATGAAFGRAIGYATASVAALAMMGALLRSARATRPETPDVLPRQIMSYAGPLMAIEAAFRVFNSIDVLLIAALVGGGAPLAAFGLPMRLVTFLEYPAAAVGSAVSPRLARRDRRGSDVALLANSLRYLLILQMLLTAPLVVWSEPLVHLLFGDKYAGAADVLRALTPYIFLGGIAQPATLTVNYLGAARQRVPIALAMLALNAALDVVLLPRLGVVAGAIGTSAAYLLWVPAHLWILRRRAGLELRPLASTMARITCAGAAAAGALAALGTGPLPVWRIAVGVVLAPAVYAAVLLATGELRRSEITDVRRAIVCRMSGTT